MQPNKLSQLEHLPKQAPSETDSFHKTSSQRPSPSEATCASATSSVPKRITPTRSREDKERKTLQADQILSRMHEDVSAFRTKVSGFRMKVSEARTLLTSKYDDIESAISPAMLETRSLLDLGGAAGLTRFMDALQELHSQLDALRSQQLDYEEMESRLNSMEFALGSQEDEVYDQRRSDYISLSAGDEAVVRGRSENEERSLVSTRSGPSEQPSEVRAFLSRRSEARIVRERLDALRVEKAQLIEEKRLRIRVGRVLDEDSERFLSDFDSREEYLLAELSVIEEEVSQLETRLEERDEAYFSTDPYEEEKALLQGMEKVLALAIGQEPATPSLRPATPSAGEPAPRISAKHNQEPDLVPPGLVQTSAASSTARVDEWLTHSMNIWPERKKSVEVSAGSDLFGPGQQRSHAVLRTASSRSRSSLEGAEGREGLRGHQSKVSPPPRSLPIDDSPAFDIIMTNTAHATTQTHPTVCDGLVRPGRQRVQEESTATSLPDDVQQNERQRA